MAKEDMERRDLHFYHIGRIVKVLDTSTSTSTDKKRKAVIEMWDNNVITCTIGSAKVKDNDFVVVLIDGTLQGTNVFMHPISISDVVSEEAGQVIWDKYKSLLDKTKPSHPFTG